MKTETKHTHTQGPWKVIEHGKGMGKHCVSTANAAPIPAVICEINTKSVGTNDEIRLANARLIAAAPDMLAALKSIARGRSVDVGDNGLGTVNLDKDAMQSIARAAISKAEGNV